MGLKWFKHDTNANQDGKMQNVLLDYGLEGYGLYWYCIEIIANKVDKDNIKFDLEHDARIIARNTGSTVQKVEEMMRYFVSIDLFEDCEGKITCLKLAKRLDKSMTSNPQMRELIQNFKSHDSVMIKPDEVMQDKTRLDKNNKKNVQIEPLEDYTIDSMFEIFWESYPKKTGKAKSYISFTKKLKKNHFSEIMDGLNKQLPSFEKTEKKYIPMPATWLNGERWNDEVDVAGNYKDLDTNKLLQMCRDQGISTIGRTKPELITLLKGKS